MINYTDPTYLRTIHDGLLSSAIHKDNASTLPIGLIGIYEGALPPASNVNERKKFLEFFAVWTMLKKEVNAAFVVPLLEGWTEEQVIDYISKYSKLFNSPVSGKYVLYHERLRSFLLQKIALRHFTSCNESIIQNCQSALIAKTGDEWEHYALEHLSMHLLIQAMDSKEANALKTLAYDTAHWNRQVEISKGFEWSKRMLNDMMLWASKYDDDEVIECSLNKVDLHHIEQNDAPRIMELVAQNDIETALQRIEAFGGYDKEGLQRKFILYMLCLMDLTLLDSKDKPFRKEAIEKLLKHLDNNLPVDHSILNWNDFFPSYAVFLLACEWAELNLDYLNVYKRSRNWDIEWININGPYSREQLEILFKCALEIIDFDDWFDYPSNCLKEISTVMTNQGMIQKAISCVDFIFDDYCKCSALINISAKLASQEMFQEADLFLNDAIESANSIIDFYIKSQAYRELSTEMHAQNKINQAKLFFDEAIVLARKISHTRTRSYAFYSIGIEQAKSGLIDNAFISLQEISPEDHDYIVSLKIAIADELVKRDRHNEAKLILIETNPRVNYSMEETSIELAKQGKLEEAIICAESIVEMNSRSLALMRISSEFTFQNNNENAAMVMQKSIECAHSIILEHEKLQILLEISDELFNQGKELYASRIWKEALECLWKIKDNNVMDHKSTALKNISTKLVQKGKLNETTIVFLNAIKMAKSNMDYLEQKYTLQDISMELAKQSKFYEAFKCAFFIHNEDDKFTSIKDITIELGKQGEIEKAVESALSINKISYKNNALSGISIELAKQGKIKEAIECVQIIIDETYKNGLLSDISIELARQGNFEKAFELTRGLTDDNAKSNALLNISDELVIQGKIKQAESVIMESLDLAYGISDEKWKSNTLINIATRLVEMRKAEESAFVVNEAIETLKSINEDLTKNFALDYVSSELVKQGNVSYAIQIANEISNDWQKSAALNNISAALVKKGMFEEGLEITMGINYEYYRNLGLKEISIELANQGNWGRSEKVGNEISDKKIRLLCWMDIAYLSINKNSGELSFQNYKYLKCEEARFNFMRGWAENISTSECNFDLFLKTRYNFINDTESLEVFLQKHALNTLFFGELSEYKINRFNSTLNIQWAIDIKNSFSDNDN
jgi:tetratricopeptide (TPR) repeat protein